MHQSWAVKLPWKPAFFYFIFEKVKLRSFSFLEDSCLNSRNCIFNSDFFIETEKRLISSEIFG